MNPLLQRFCRLIPALCLLVLAFGAWRALKPPPGLNLHEFGEIPVVANGRVQPLDSLARNALLAMQGKQRIAGEDAPASPIAWLAELAFDPSTAAERTIFLIHNDDVLGLVGIDAPDRKLFSFRELSPALVKIDEEASRIGPTEAQTWSPYEKGLMTLWRNLGLYVRLQNAIAHPGIAALEADLTMFMESVDAAMAETGKRERGEDFNAAVVEDATQRLQGLLEWAPRTHIYTKPPPTGSAESEWRKLPDSMIDSLDEGTIHPSTLAFARAGDAYRSTGTDRASVFNRAVAGYHKWLANEHPKALAKARAETTFNRLSPFTACMALYVVALLAAILSWLVKGDALRKSAFQVLLVGFVIHTIGLVVRMALEGRPPVTNLYSSAVFIGWGAIVLSVFLEWFHRNGIGTAVAALTGFTTLVIAHHLSLSGDTLEMMRAVLDSNFWLATHVIVITLGYSATFLAGAIAIFYLIRHACGGVPKSAGLSMRGMVYGIICFATLASFVGTVLGGIWADQSWGRFWGWDPKENGALLIVLWNAIILHARWGGMIREKGMMVMAVFGNIVTSWSWFGTNMLGIGLHSYGFTDAAFLWLTIFIVSQLVIMGLGIVHRTERPA